MRRLECDPSANLDDPDMCRACGNDGRPECGECGGTEPAEQLEQLPIAAE